MTDTMIDASRGRPRGQPRLASSIRPEKIFEAAAKAGRNVRMKVDKDGSYTVVMGQPGDLPDEGSGENEWDEVLKKGADE